MKNIIITVLIFFMFGSISYAQTDLNAYKYVIIPRKYDFLKDENKYELNALTKFLFTKKGFETLYEGENYPVDLLGNPCLSVKADVHNNSNLFTTKLTIVLTDCHSKEVYSSIEGKSKEKEYKKTYHEALRSAFISIDNLNYRFDPDLAANTQLVAKAQTPAEVSPKEVPKVVPVPVVTAAAVEGSQNIKKEDAQMAKTYRNDMISFLLIEQGPDLVAYISESNSANYKKGEKIGTFTKTSLPNVYRVSWKTQNGISEQTTGYFDDNGDLKIDINRNGKIEVIVFKHYQ